MEDLLFSVSRHVCVSDWTEPRCCIDLSSTPSPRSITNSSSISNLNSGEDGEAEQEAQLAADITEEFVPCKGKLASQSYPGLHYHTKSLTSETSVPLLSRAE
ncbi:hypothetical protein PoB_001390600 [Plakobranchus ocellatus]|uniref:Uncharacterized protein n=1 Tax=Plakobranchus ocellatus TaxID=259542 RepID=A0AAV3YYE5_9GAST|nr:hypothetical protein PoB_001390600 [Plakobranchus ocellatus]